MNMPLRRPDWRRDCLLAANHELIAHYQQSPSACLALQISRNYRLLLTQDDRLSLKDIWRSYSKNWFGVYCKHKHIEPSTLSFSI